MDISKLSKDHYFLNTKTMAREVNETKDLKTLNRLKIITGSRMAGNTNSSS